MGQIPVLMYHAIKQTIVSPQRLRQDIALLKAAGFYPTTIREMAEGRMDIPAGKSPVVLTFDDSSPTHYRIIDDGSLDPDCVVAILQAAVAAVDWAPKATFFPLLYVDPPANIVFGQPAFAEKKLRNLVEWGYEIGSHSVTHQDLSAATPIQIKRELAQSKSRLEAMIGGGYKIYSLSPPYGEYPRDESLVSAGKYKGLAYKYSAVVMAWGSSAPSPFASTFDPMRIPRITAYPQNTVRDLVEHFRLHPELRFVSDGDQDVVSFPGRLSAELGTLKQGLELRVVRY
jgi:peptidoglycan/xylan/chitin deacetylase (PgdA/CDA1 family)